MTDRQPATPAGEHGGFQPYAGILAECRDLIARRSLEVLREAIAEIDQELEAKRKATSSVEQSLLLLEAQYQLRRLADSFDNSFQSSFTRQFRERSRSREQAGSVYGGDSDFLPELSLVAEEQISDELIVQNLSNQLQSRCDEELQALQPRIALMLGEDELDPTDNPLGPDALCETLREMCWALDGAQENRVLLLQLLTARLGQALLPIYHDLNTLLVARRILPQGVPRSRGRRPPPPPATATGKESPADMNPDSAMATDRMDVVQQLFAPRGGGSSSASGGGPAAPGGLRPDWQTASNGGELMQALTRLQHGEQDVTLGEDAFSLADRGDGRSGNVLNQLIGAGIRQHLGSVDGIVIDVVATLFDYIFEDQRVPDSMKGLIGRLQIPVLKLALMDHGFFSNRNHPARRLINQLAQAAATWDGELDADSTLHQVAEAIVQRIQDEFTDSQDIFATCLHTLETYLLEQERAADARAATLTDRLAARERQELALETARNAIAHPLEDPGLPAAVRDFLQHTWVKALMHASLHDDDSGERWRAAVGTMDELVWSVQTKKGADARQQLVKRLPALLSGLRHGMTAAGMEDAARDAFLAELVRLHAAAIKADMAAESAGEDGATEPRPPSPMPPLPAAAPDVAAAEASDLDHLVRGDWIELQDEQGEVRRVRLSWISPARSMYLFANRQGQRALALTRNELARRFRDGEARVADAEALIDRIVDNVLDGYQAKSGEQRA